MKDHWTDKNIILDDLAQEVRLFFTEKGFTTRLDKNKDTLEVTASIKDDSGPRNARIKIYGNPKDFFVEFNSAEEETRSMLKLKSLITLFGGGALLLRPYQAAEFYQKLEEEFWTYVDQLVDRLANSAR